jgi:D-threo-aldose 1-dehydrogenase
VTAGVRSIDELDENLAMTTHPIPSAFWRDLRTEGLLPAAAPVPGEAAP